MNFEERMSEQNMLKGGMINGPGTCGLTTSSMKGPFEVCDHELRSESK